MPMDDVVLQGDHFWMRFHSESTRTNAQVVSTLPQRMGDMDNPVGKAAVDAVESLVLAHFCANVDVTSRDYVYGLNVAVEAIAENLP